MKTLVTGGAGFIGSNLVDRLVESGHDVIVLDNLSTGNIINLDKVKNKIKFINIDITKQNLDDYFENVDQVFHLAGLADIVPSIKNPKAYFDVNLLGTLNVLEAAKNKQVKKCIYAASASCYGIPSDYPTNEKSKIDPKYPYALTKYLAEEMVIHWAKVYKMPNISLRFFNAYGMRSRTTGAYGAVFGVFLAQKLANKPLTIVGDGNQTRDFIHVSDLVEAIILAAQRGKNSEIYNVGGGKEISVNSIADMISSNKVYIPERPGEPNRSLADISKIKSDLNWEPKIDIEDGVKMLIKNINQWKDAPVWTPDSIAKATKEWFDFLS
jgi:UDP-glucose 4-epimerase|tara:strand:- start:94 stop:1068 length:975 start_codon:yes stop_codon:yes gene_type:complete